MFDFCAHSLLTRAPYTLVIRKLLLQSACALLFEQLFYISAPANSIHFATISTISTFGNMVRTVVGGITHYECGLGSIPVL